MKESEGDSIRILGVDSALRSTGLGLIRVRGTRLEILGHGLVKNPAAWPRSRCLKNLHAAITDILEQSKPESVAIEGVFFCKNVRTAVILGEVRGAVLAACAAAGKPVYEYPPRRVKQAVVGFGAASKDCYLPCPCPETWDAHGCEGNLSHDNLPRRTAGGEDAHARSAECRRRGLRSVHSLEHF
ncbi:MAG: crossover junction endodeoxyribonuclease RuvC [Lentisphaerae bacterium]|nr:crossover junction endodeoxyribonuclease RuvC [Lentisphaerota bacterium]